MAASDPTFLSSAHVTDLGFLPRLLRWQLAVGTTTHCTRLASFLPAAWAGASLQPLCQPHAKTCSSQPLHHFVLVLWASASCLPSRRRFHCCVSCALTHRALVCLSPSCPCLSLPSCLTQSRLLRLLDKWRVQLEQGGLTDARTRRCRLNFFT